MTLLDDAMAVWDVATRKGQLHVTGENGSDQLVGFFVPAAEMNRLGQALVVAGARQATREDPDALGRMVDMVAGHAIVSGVLDRNYWAKEIDQEAVRGVVVMAMEEAGTNDVKRIASMVDWPSIRRRGETREEYRDRTGS